MSNFKMEGITIPTWDTIKSYFDATDRQHMLNYTNGQLDLWDCNTVKTWADKIWAKVASGEMPPGGPRWTKDQLNNFYSWWKQGTCPPAAK